MRPYFAASIFALAALSAEEKCAPKPPTTCHTDGCTSCVYCRGPANEGGNAPVRPRTCNGDVIFTLAGLYWQADEDGLEYAIENETIGSDAISLNPELNNLFEAHYLTPNQSWKPGFKAGLAYVSSCDGWDTGILWTWYKGRNSSHVEAEFEDNNTLLPLWSAFQYPNAGNASILFASDIETSWNFDLNMIDVTLGREFWTSKRVTVHPYIGLRIAYIDQKYKIRYKGGSWNDPGLGLNFHDYISLTNDFKGVGVYSGVDGVWNFGCGWGLYGGSALSLLYGRFHIANREWIQNAVAPFSKSLILQSNESFRATRAVLDLNLAIQWATLVCDCQYGLTVSLGWEQHLFFHQNQLWRVVRFGGVNGSGLFNNSGENVFDQRRGTLSTSGWTLSAKFDF